MAWEDKRQVSKYADSLVQVNNGKKISPDPKTWKCEESGMTENLWLNLSDGHIGSGRAQMDATGQMTGGTGAVHLYGALMAVDGLYRCCAQPLLRAEKTRERVPVGCEARHDHSQRS